jgi:hypothetical protein
VVRCFGCLGGRHPVKESTQVVDGRLVVDLGDG